MEETKRHTHTQSQQRFTAAHARVKERSKIGKQEEKEAQRKARDEGGSRLRLRFTESFLLRSSALESKETKTRVES